MTGKNKVKEGLVLRIRLLDFVIKETHPLEEENPIKKKL